MALKIGTVEPTEIKVIENGTTTDLTVYKYATTGSDLGEAKRSAVSTYTKANLDGWIGKENDTWSGITNASSLVANKYYYIRVLVSDTNKYGKFCVRFKSYSGQTITVDNMGWGYDGEVIYSTPVWGKPFSMSFTKGTGVASVTVTRTSSPNEHASLTTLSSGARVYYGDVLSVSATAEQGYTLDEYTTSYTVTNVLLINITATKDAQYKFAYAPVIVGDSYLDEQSGSYTFTCTIKNRNQSTHPSTDAIVKWKLDSYESPEGTTVLTMSSSSESFDIYRDEKTERGVQISAYFTAENYENSDVTVESFNGFVKEETTTTTTTE